MRFKQSCQKFEFIYIYLHTYIYIYIKRVRHRFIISQYLYDAVFKHVGAVKQLYFHDDLRIYASLHMHVVMRPQQ